MGFFRSLGQVLGGVAALVGQKAFLDSQSCGISLTEATMPSRLFSTALNCTSKKLPVIISVNESFVIQHLEPFGAITNITVPTTPDPNTFSEATNPHNITLLASLLDLPPLTSVLGLILTAFTEIYFEHGCWVALNTVLLPLVLRMRRAINLTNMFHSFFMPLLLGCGRFTIVIMTYLKKMLSSLLMTLLPYLMLPVYGIIGLTVDYLGKAYTLITAVKRTILTQPKPIDHQLQLYIDAATASLSSTVYSQAAQITQLRADITANEAKEEQCVQHEAARRCEPMVKENRGLRDQVRSLEREIRDLRFDVDALNEELKDTKLEFEKAEQAANQPDPRLESITSQLAERQNLVDSLTVKAKNLESQLAEMQEDVKSQSRRADSAESELKESRQAAKSSTTRAEDGEKKLRESQQTVARLTEEGRNAALLLGRLQQAVNQQRKRAEDAEQQVQQAQENADQAWTQAQNAETRLEDYEKHAEEMWAKANKDAEKTLGEYKKRAEDAETQSQQAQKAARDASYRTKDAEYKLKLLQDLVNETANTPSVPHVSAAPSNQAQATGATNAHFQPATATTSNPTNPLAAGGNHANIPPKLATAPPYNPTRIPTFGGGAVGTIRPIPNISGTPTQSLVELADHLKNKYKLHGPNDTPAPAISGHSPPSALVSLSGLPGPSDLSPPYIPGLPGASNSSPPYTPGLSGPVAAPTNATPGRGPITNPFNPNAKPFDPEAPPYIPIVGFPDDDAASDSSSSLSSPPPSDDEDDVSWEDALSDNGLNDLSNFPDPYDNAWDPNDTAWDALDGNKAPADVMAGRKMAQPRGRRGGASARRHEHDAIARRRSAERLVARLARLEKKARENGRTWPLVGNEDHAENAVVSNGGNGAESAAVEGGGNGGNEGNSGGVGVTDDELLGEDDEEGL
jgi:chemotaxis protein histidine kinase CheA